MNKHNREIIIEQLFKDNYNKLYIYALSIIHDKEGAKDIVSDIFHSIWEMDTLPAESMLSSFMYKCVRNSCIDFIRHTEVLRNYESHILSQSFPDNDDISEREEKLSHIMNMIDTLPPQTKIVFKACFLDGKKYKELSGEMNISVNTIKSHIMKALKVLRIKFRNKN